MPSLEIACFSLSSALLAAASGADRLELCSNYELDGTTPDYANNPLLTTLSIPQNIMIRPLLPHPNNNNNNNLSSDFVVTPAELAVMKAQIMAFPRAHGFVFGILCCCSSSSPKPQDSTANNENSMEIDETACRELLSLAAGRPCTFHRAFDRLPPSQMRAGLEILIELGFKAVLTSGGKGSAVEGKERLRELVEWAGGRIEVVVGGGVRAGNLGALRGGVGDEARWWHSSAMRDGECDGEEVRAMRRVLDGAVEEG